MRFHATPESVENGEITILAIIETVLSVAIYISIGLHFGNFRHLAWAILVAPIMLLRTQRSAQWGLRKYSPFNLKMHKKLSNLMDKTVSGFFSNAVNFFTVSVLVGYLAFRGAL